MSYRNNSGGGLPYNPPYVIDVRVDRELMKFTPLFTGYLLDVIVQTSSKNATRAMFRRFAEERQDAVTEMVTAVAEISEFFIFSDNLNESQVEGAISDAAEIVVNAYLVLAIDQFPDDFGPTLTEEARHDMRDYINVFQQVTAEAKQFAAGSRGGRFGNADPGERRFGNITNGPNRYRNNSGGGRNAGSAVGTRYGGGTANANARTSRWDEEGQAGWQANRQEDNRPRYRAGKANSMWDDTGVRANAVGSAPAASSGVGRVGRVLVQTPATQAAAAPVRETVRPVNSVMVGDLCFVQLDQKHEWPKVTNPDRPWDHILAADGTQIQPAFMSKWTVSFNPEVPAVPHYDPGAQILLYLKTTDQKVQAKAYDWDPSMEYLQHEINPALRRRAEEEQRRREGKVAPAWNLVADLRPRPSSPLATSEPVDYDKEALEVTAISNIFQQTTNLVDAVNRVSFRLRADDPEKFKKPFELYLDRAILTTVVDVDLEKLLLMSNADSFTKLHQLMCDIEGSESFTLIDERVTIGLNQALRQNLGIPGLSVDSFYEDWSELRDVLEAQYGEQVLTTLEEAGVEVISRWLSHYEADEINEVATMLGIEANDKALIWAERCSVTRLPLSSAELSLPADTGFMVSPTIAPEIHNTLQAIFARTPDLPVTYFARYLATNDGVVYLITRGYLNDEAILVFKTDIVVK